MGIGTWDLGLTIKALSPSFSFEAQHYIRDQVTYDELNIFKWLKENSFMHSKAKEVLMMVEKMLEDNASHARFIALFNMLMFLQSSLAASIRSSEPQAAGAKGYSLFILTKTTSTRPSMPGSPWMPS